MKSILLTGLFLLLGACQPREYEKKPMVLASMPTFLDSLGVPTTYMGPVASKDSGFLFPVYYHSIHEAWLVPLPQPKRIWLPDSACYETVVSKRLRKTAKLKVLVPDWATQALEINVPNELTYYTEGGKLLGSGEASHIVVSSVGFVEEYFAYSSFPPPQDTVYTYLVTSSNTEDFELLDSPPTWTPVSELPASLVNVGGSAPSNDTPTHLFSIQVGAETYFVSTQLSEGQISWPTQIFILSEGNTVQYFAPKRPLENYLWFKPLPFKWNGKLLFLAGGWFRETPNVNFYILYFDGEDYKVSYNGWLSRQ